MTIIEGRACVRPAHSLDSLYHTYVGVGSAGPLGRVGELVALFE